MNQFAKMSAATFCYLTLLTFPSNAQDIPLAMLCSDLKGGYLSAPTWKLEEDANTNQNILLDYRIGSSKSYVSWSLAGKEYYKGEGVGFSMKGGFVIVIPASEYIETYTYNAGATEVYVSATRSGSSVLPNAIKSYRGSCKPAGAMVR